MAYDTREKYNKWARDNYHKNINEKRIELNMKYDKYYKNNPAWKQKHAMQVKLNNHKITEKEYTKLLISQQFRCAACRNDLTLLPNKQIHIDHDHSTHKIRGVLCVHCNLALGHMKDNPINIRKLASYIERHA